MNWQNIIVLVIVAAAVTYATVRIVQKYRKAKKGIVDCGCDCSGCANCAQCSLGNGQKKDGYFCSRNLDSRVQSTVMPKSDTPK
ncbi:MAG: FeoB-associated Cys-rich membrane protein [Bacteroidales bacterium]|nr:FeoB-associated Cys-rich membrane protein [Bacteroidales bacterium]